MKESEIVKDCLEYLSARGILAWRQNTTGIFNAKSGGYYFHGKKGVSDLLGVFVQEVTVDKKKVKMGIFLAVEVKMPKKKPSEHQELFLKEVNDRGGIGLCVHSVEELHEALSEYV